MKTSFKRGLASALSIIMMVTLCACGNQGQDPQQTMEVLTWQEQYDLGVRYLSEGNYEEAIIAFTAAIEIDPKQASAYIGRGDAYMLGGENDENLALAQGDYTEALGLDAKNMEIYLKLAEVFFKKDDMAAALGILQQGYDLTKSNAIFQKMLELEGLIEEIVESEKQSEFYSDNMLMPEDLCVGKEPFWQVSIFDAIQFYSNYREDQTGIEEFDDGYTYNAFAPYNDYSWGYVMLQQGKNVPGLNYIQYILTSDDGWGRKRWVDTPLYIKDIVPQMSRESFLKSSGLSPTGIQNFISFDNSLYFEYTINGNWLGRGMAHTPEDSFIWNDGHNSLDDSSVTFLWRDIEGFHIEARFLFSEDKLQAIHLSHLAN